MTAEDLNARYDPMSRDELIAECEKLRTAITTACSDMGCFCPDGQTGVCPMCVLEKALRGASTRKAE
jgi:hypothetical protein